jgi:hypothetical protein
LNDDEPLVRGACAWALGRYADAEPEVQEALARRGAIEMHDEVKAEINAAIRVRQQSGIAARNASKGGHA